MFNGSLWKVQVCHGLGFVEGEIVTHEPEREEKEPSNGNLNRIHVCRGLGHVVGEIVQRQ